METGTKVMVTILILALVGAAGWFGYQTVTLQQQVEDLNDANSKLQKQLDEAQTNLETTQAKLDEMEQVAENVMDGSGAMMEGEPIPAE